MIFLRRNKDRHNCNWSVGVCLVKGKIDEDINYYIPGMVRNISYAGAELHIADVKMKNQHLVYDAMGNYNINIQIIFDPDITDKILLAKPIWLNKDLGVTKFPFKIGVQFLQSLSSVDFQHFCQIK